ncbi:serine acetyltransferase [Microbacterium sp. NPDC055903]
MTVGMSPRQRFRMEWSADKAANSAYPKSRFVLRWLRSAQRWRRSRGPLARAMFVVVGGSYKLITEGFMGIELPVSTSIGPGLRLRHGVGLVVNPASTIGAGVMLRQGVTLGNRKGKNDCPAIGDGVEIGVGAVVIGAITVGENARIGPNAVVFRDVPAGAIVLSPASEIRLP